MKWRKAGKRSPFFPSAFSVGPSRDRSVGRELALVVREHRRVRHFGEVARSGIWMGDPSTMRGQEEDKHIVVSVDAIEGSPRRLDHHLVSSPTSVLELVRRESLDSEAAEGPTPASPDCGSLPRSFRAPAEIHQLRASECSVSGQLRESFPGREVEIRQLLGLLGDPFDHLLPLLVYGGASTGKTSIVKQAFNLLRRPYAYVSTRFCHSPRLLFESILNQLEGHVRSASNDYSSAKRCDRIGDFVSYLPEACVQAIAASHREERACGFETGSRVVYIVIDNLELVRDWSGGSNLLAGLVRLPELTRLPNLGLVFISNLGADSFHCSTGFRDLSPLFFRDYKQEELHTILLKHSTHPDLYSSFLRQVLTPFARSTSRLTELSQSLGPLYRKYCQPADSGCVNPRTKSGKQKLYHLLKDHIPPALLQSFPVDAYAPGKSCEPGPGRKKKTAHKFDFHLSACSKYLLLAAYIASRNPATLDGTLFDSTAPDRGPKRRRCSALSVEKRDFQIREKQLKGPGSFPLERLLGIFKVTVAHHSADSRGTAFAEGGAIAISADVLMQLSTLVSVGLLIKGSSNPLEGSSRYCCNVDEDFIREVAQSMSFPLSKYLLHG